MWVVVCEGLLRYDVQIVVIAPHKSKEKRSLPQRECSSGWGCWARVRQNFLRLDVEGARWPIRFSFRPSTGVSLTTRK